MTLSRSDQNSSPTDLGKKSLMILAKRNVEKFIVFCQSIRTDMEQTPEITELRSYINIVEIFVNGEKLVKYALFINELDKTQAQDKERIIGKRYDSIKSF